MLGDDTIEGRCIGGICLHVMVMCYGVKRYLLQVSNDP